MIGPPNRRIVSRHILPNLLAPVIAPTGIALALAILAEAALSFFGLGA
jgi:peptide/nickel transport system permease protein